MKHWKAVPCTDYTWDVRDENGVMIASNLTRENAEFISNLANERFEIALCHGKEISSLD